MTRTLADVKAQLEAMIRRAGTARALAEDLEVDPTRISEVMNNRPPSKQLLAALGLRKVLVYESVVETRRRPAGK